MDCRTHIDAIMMCTHYITHLDGLQEPWIAEALAVSYDAKPADLIPVLLSTYLY